MQGETPQPATNTNQPQTLPRGNPNTQILVAENKEARKPRTKLQDMHSKRVILILKFENPELSQEQTIEPRNGFGRKTGSVIF